MCLSTSCLASWHFVYLLPSTVVVVTSWICINQKVSRCSFKLKRFCSETSDSLSLSIKHLQLSAVRNVWLFMMTICILFVMIALHQYSTLQPSQTPYLTYSPISPSSASPFRGFLISHCCCYWRCLLMCWGSSCQTRGGWETNANLFNTGCWALFGCFFAGRLHVWLDTTGCGVNKNQHKRCF